MARRKLPFRTSVRISKDRLVECASYSDSDVPEFERMRAGKVSRGKMCELLGSPDERVAITCIRGGVKLYEHELRFLVDKQLDMVKREGVLWTPFVDQLYETAVNSLEKDQLGQHLRSDQWEDILRRFALLTRWVRRQKRSSAKLELRHFSSLELRGMVLSESPHCPDVLSAFVRDDSSLLLRLAFQAEWTYGCAEWVLRRVIADPKAFGGYAVLESVQLVNACATQALKTVDGCVLVARCVDLLTTSELSVRLTDCLPQLPRLERSVIAALRNENTLGRPTRGQVASLLACQRSELRECAIGLLTRLG